LRIAAIALSLLMLTVTGASGQNTADADLSGQLKKLFPNATSFSAKTGTPAVYRALGPGGEKDVIGFAYWTTELEPLERGFDGPIKMLVGMDMKGLLTGVIVTDHREPYGYFSVDLPEWPTQFTAKNIRDPFKVGSDVDAIARATISVTSASRAVRNASRKVARAYLAPPPAAPATAQAVQ
jgi:transcriptional regulator of nitric oxide reductase